MDFDREEPLSYTSTGDIKAYRRATDRMMWQSLTPWAGKFYQLSYWLVLMSAVGYSIPTRFTDDFRWDGLGWATVLGFFAYNLWTIYTSEKAKTVAETYYATESWACEISSKSYVFSSSEGLKTSVPWELMKIEREDPGLYQINYLHYTIPIYRKPLRDAGLEEEFRSRIGKKPTSEVREMLETIN